MALPEVYLQRHLERDLSPEPDGDPFQNTDDVHDTDFDGFSGSENEENATAEDTSSAPEQQVWALTLPPDFSDVEDDETTPIPTVDQLLAYMNLWARPHGYAVNKTQARMKKKGGGYRRYTFACDRYSDPLPSKAKSRNTSG